MKNIINNNRSWYFYDLSDKVLGRASSEIASILLGKHLTSYNRSSDCGDCVVAVNAAKFRLTGSKIDQKHYYKHSGYIGNLKTESLGERIKLSPEKVVINSISGMLPKNKLRAQILKRLKVYGNENHPHQNIKFVKEIK